MTGESILNGCHAAVAPTGGLRAPELVRHLAVALSRHVRALRQAGAPVPAEVDEFAAFLAHSVRRRQDTTGVDEDLGRTDSPPVADRLLVTKGEAAERLGVSVRTVERLISAGRLPVIHVERAARVRASDLEAYVHHLPEGQASPSHVEDSAWGRAPEHAPPAR